MSAQLRAKAAQVISKVVTAGNSLTQALEAALQNTSFTVTDRSLFQALCFGTIRHYPKWQALIGDALKNPLKKTDGDIHALIALGMFQLLESRVPAHAAISETVSACVILKKKWAKGLINAILRRLQREPAWPTQVFVTQPWAEISFPKWLWRKTHKNWPEDAYAILQASNIQGPMTIRVNTVHHSVSEYQQLLIENGISSLPHDLAKDALILQQAVAVEKLPGFFQGKASVQDAAAQMAVSFLALELVNNKHPLRILDACAAPGGKTGHILEKLATVHGPNAGHCVALDKDAIRLKKVSENLQRLCLDAQLIVADAADVVGWWDGIKFDRVLLDAPCSGTGVIRRHPDIKILRRNSDITELVQIQRQLLKSLWPLVEEQGLLVYATCSILSDENEAQIAWFLNTFTDASEKKITFEKPLPAHYGWQIAPGWENMDGFYYAVMQKNATT